MIYDNKLIESTCSTLSQIPTIKFSCDLGINEVDYYK